MVLITNPVMTDTCYNKNPGIIKLVGLVLPVSSSSTANNSVG